MTHITGYTIGAVLALAVSSTAWAQQQDLEVTMHVVPANASPGAVTGEIKLPETAEPRAKDAAAFGLDTANRARELGREFGIEKSQAARERPRPPTPSVPSKK